MNNLDLIEKKINKRYLQYFFSFLILLYFSFNHFKGLIYGELYSKISTSQYISNSLWIGLSLLSIIGILLMILNKIFIHFYESGLKVGIIVHFLGVTGSYYFFFKKGIIPSNLFFAILGMMVSIIFIIFVFGFSIIIYKNICDVQEVKHLNHSAYNQLEKFKKYANPYNNKVQNFNQFTKRIEHLGEMINAPYKRKDLQEINYETEVPLYDCDNIGFFSCKKGEYRKKVQKYIERCEKESIECVSQSFNMEKTMRQKEEILSASEETVGHIREYFSEEGNENFKTVARAVFSSLKEKIKAEKRIKPMRRNRRWKIKFWM